MPDERVNLAVVCGCGRPIEVAIGMPDSVHHIWPSPGARQAHVVAYQHQISGVSIRQLIGRFQVPKERV